MRRKNWTAAYLGASKTVSVFSEDGSDRDVFDADAPEDLALPVANPGPVSNM
jgi:hypothetical protein